MILTRVSVSQLDSQEHCDQELDGQQPDEDHLPEAKITRRPVIGRNLRVAIEKTLANSENMHAGEENTEQANAEKDAESNNRVCMRMHNGERRSDQNNFVRLAREQS